MLNVSFRSTERQIPGKSREDNAVAVLAELLTRAYPCPPLTPRIPAAAGHPEHAAHCFDAELSLMFFNKDILHFRRFAKYVAAFWRIASSSSRSASWRLRRAISVDISSSRSEDVC